MASKQTKRERRDLAKKQRLEAQRRAARAKRLRKVFGLAITAGAIALIVFLIMWSGKADREKVASLNKVLADAGCTPVQTKLQTGRDHITQGQTVTYESSPPTSGNHAGQWAKTGIHVTAIPNETQVHNLEHGHVVFQYKESVPPAIRTAFEDLARSDPTWVIAAPNASMTPAIGFTAWGKVSTCDGATDAAKVKAAAQQFVAVNKDNGPESIAGDPNAPGQGGSTGTTDAGGVPPGVPIPGLSPG